MGVVIILAAQALVSLAIIMYFQTHHPEEHHWWTTLVAPLIALVTQAYVIYLCLSNMAFLMLLRRMGRGDLTAHGFRATFKTWASERSMVRSDAPASSAGTSTRCSWFPSPASRARRSTRG